MSIKYIAVADKWREVLSHVLVSIVCLFYVVDVRTVALFKQQLQDLENCFIFSLHQQT